MFRGSEGYMLSKNRPDEGTLVNWQSCKPLWAIHYCPSVLMYVVERDSWLLHIFVGVVLLTLPADGFTADLIQRWSLRATCWMYYALQTPELSSYTKSFCLSLSNTRVHAGPGPYWLRLSLTNTHTDLIRSTLHILCGVTTPCPAPFPRILSSCVHPFPWQLDVGRVSGLSVYACSPPCSAYTHIISNTHICCHTFLVCFYCARMH